MEVWICDDSAVSARTLERMIAAVEAAQVRIFCSPERLEEELSEASAVPQALFLDIVFHERLHDTLSVEAAERIHSEYPHLPIVFVTAHVEYAPEIFEAAPVYLLQKPFEEARISAALRAVHERCAQDAAEVLTIRQKGEVRLVPYTEIDYIESDRRKLMVHTGSNIHTCCGKLADLLGQVPPYFVQCHQSFAVNLNRVRRLQGETVVLLSGDVVPISRRRRQAFRSAVDLFTAQPTFVL